MIHIIVVHFKTSEWIDLQLKQIKKHFSNYKIWTYCDGFNILPHQNKFHFCQNSITESNKLGYIDHILKLNSLTDIVLKDLDTNNNDLLIWLDSDAFPINNANDYISKKMLKYPFIAVNRPENDGDVIPHPSFTCTSVSFWKKYKLTWDGIPGESGGLNKKGLHDPGGKLYQDLLENDIEWYRMRRTKSLTKHEVFFTIYDDFIYHHGAGSRGPRNKIAGCRGGNFGVLYNKSEILKVILEKINTKKW